MLDKNEITLKSQMPLEYIPKQENVNECPPKRGQLNAYLHTTVPTYWNECVLYIEAHRGTSVL